MSTPDELADALWGSESRWVNKMTHITHSYGQVADIAESLRDRAERFGGEQ